jgi:hypothetical protein
MLWTPRFGVPRIGVAGQVGRVSILRLAAERSAAKMMIDGKYIRIYKPRSYEYTNRRLVVALVVCLSMLQLNCARQGGGCLTRTKDPCL